jgi:rifampicin phosphotransferase
MQGMLRPFTPMGMAAMRIATALSMRSVGLPADPYVGHPAVVDVAGRIYLDLTALVRTRRTRGSLPTALAIYGPRVRTAAERVLEDPRFSPDRDRPWRWGPALRIAVRVGPGLLAGTAGALIAPARARRRAMQAADAVEQACRPASEPLSTLDRLRRAAAVQGAFLGVAMRAMLPPIYAALLAKEVAAGLLAGVALPGEIDATLRGMPHNPTTEMDLALWRLAAAAAPAHRALLRDSPPAELAARYRAGDLPDIGLDAFLRRYGHRAAAEVDVGVPRWVEDPAPVFSAIAGYLAADAPDPAERYARAAEEAVVAIDALVGRARRSRPVRARAAGLLLRRSREIAGLRELPKSAWLHAFAEMRRQLLAVGAELHARGLLDRPDDVMFLDLRETLAAVRGADHRALVAARRAEHGRESARRSVPGLLLSDGTIPEALAAATLAADGVLTGMAAAPGTVTGPVRIVLDPTDARVEPGEILVAPTTDPGWTPLFMTAGGLVTETGSPMAHGPTVAREYGIPAVICVHDATGLLSTGQIVTVDGAAGTVTPAQDRP